MKFRFCFSIIAAALGVTAYAQTNVMKLRTDRPGAEIQPTMYGIFIEDINFAADGGLYAELVMNRSFEFPDRLHGWRAAGRFEVRDDGPFERNPHYLRLIYPGHPHKHTALENDGFFGIGVRAGEDYRFSVWARVPGGRPGTLEVQLMDRSSMAEDQAFASARITVDSPEWKKYEFSVTIPEDPAAYPDVSGRMVQLVWMCWDKNADTQVRLDDLRFEQMKREQ